MLESDHGPQAAPSPLAAASTPLEAGLRLENADGRRDWNDKKSESGHEYDLKQAQVPMSGTQEELRRTGTLSDVKLLIATVEGTWREFKAHKVILASKSRYFALLFTRGFQEQLTTSVKLPDFFESEGFSALLDCIYGLELKLPSVDLVPKMLEMADYLDLPRETEVGLILALKGNIQSIHSHDALLLYGLLKGVAKTAEKRQHKPHVQEACGLLLKALEENIAENVKEILQPAKGTALGLDVLPRDIALNLLEGLLNYISDNETLSLILNTMRKKLNAPSYFHMLSLVQLHCNACYRRSAKSTANTSAMSLPTLAKAAISTSPKTNSTPATCPWRVCLRRRCLGR
jgi:hypothetical protein